jgi:hypothetical protein
MEDQPNTVTGLYIQGVVLYNPALNSSEAELFSLIHAFVQDERGCIASNAYLAYSLNVTIRTIQRGISKLKTEEYIKEVSFDGRIRELGLADGWFVDHVHFVKEFNKGLRNRVYLQDNPDPDPSPKSGPTTEKPGGTRMSPRYNR